MNKPVCLNLSECTALGDLLCSTPTISTLAKSYQNRITVLSPMPELFKNNPHVQASYKHTSVDMHYFNQNYIMHNSFYNIGKKNERGIEYKHNRTDIRQIHSINLGFMLTPNEMQCTYVPIEPPAITIEQVNYIVIHPVQNWPSRTWSADNWQKLTKCLNKLGYYVVAIGKDSSETGFFDVDKPVFNFEIEYGMNLINKTSISQCWHVLNNASAFITMDSGLLHLAGTTDTFICLLGSSIDPFYRMPYRNGSQQYKSVYVSGTCNAFCASDMKHGVAEWGDIQGVPPLIGCLEKKQVFECHPDFAAVANELISHLSLLP